MPRKEWKTGRAAALALLVCGSVAALAPAHAQDTPPDYRDDRSTPQSLVESLYNAIERGEYLRAWSYLRDEPDRPGFEAFAKGYEGTRHVRVKVAEGISDGAAGSIYYTVPTVVEAVGTRGTEVFRGCYTLRLVQPAAQLEPPYQPLGIVKGTLEKTDASFDAAEGVCPEAG
ncbi:MAG: hypothetical protein DI629_03190 [Mesorhizobium amorphae]|nr:MAG: hypothetical protein DI629_03190 [Mesorhizobium amorphae]